MAIRQFFALLVVGLLCGNSRAEFTVINVLTETNSNLEYGIVMSIHGTRLAVASPDLGLTGATPRVDLYDMESAALTQSIETPQVGTDVRFGVNLLLDETICYIFGGPQDRSSTFVDAFDVESGKLLGSATGQSGPGGAFGASIVAYRKRILLGDPFSRTGRLQDAGAVRMYNSRLRALGKFSSMPPVAGGMCGREVAASGDRILVSENVDGTTGTEGSMKILVYGRKGARFHREGELETTFPLGVLGLTANSRYVVVGQLGSATVFDTKTGRRMFDLVAPTATPPFYGQSPAVTETHFVLWDGVRPEGRVYLFDMSGAVVQVISNPDATRWSAFGQHVAASEDYLAASAESISGVKQVLVFRRK